MELSAEARAELLSTLETRFEKNMMRHHGLEWAKVQARLEANAEKLWSLNEMEKTGGEPDVVGFDQKTGETIFYDCSAQSPEGRRSLCYDGHALDSRKANKPKGSAVDMASAMGIALLTEEQYRALQKLGKFDTKTSSWIETPPDIRKTRRRDLCRLPLRSCFRVSQRCGILLCRQRVSRFAQGLELSVSFTTCPPFMTSAIFCVFSSERISASGFVRVMTTSANFPASSVPI